MIRSLTIRRSRISGFTLIELLVVIAIIAVLVALLLPAVQSAREAARRVQCVNNLMQLGLALKNYESSFEMLPSGVVDPSKGPILSTPKGYHVSWIVQILPYIDQRNLYRKFDFKNGTYSAANVTVRDIRINTLICPSDIFVAPSCSSYAAVHHDGESPIDSTNSGVFFLNSHVRYEDILDGSSNTLFIGEKINESTDLGWASGTRATLRNTGFTPNHASNGFLPVSNLGGLNNNNGEDEDAAPKKAPITGAGAAGTTSEDITKLVGGFSSRHPGGANFALGDGAVRFIKSTIDPKVFRLLANRADGELLSSENY